MSGADQCTETSADPVCNSVKHTSTRCVFSLVTSLSTHQLAQAAVNLTAAPLLVLHYQALVQQHLAGLRAAALSVQMDALSDGAPGPRKTAYRLASLS